MPWMSLLQEKLIFYSYQVMMESAKLELTNRPSSRNNYIAIKLQESNDRTHYL